MKVDISLLDKVRRRLNGEGFTREEYQSASERVAPGMSTRSYLDMMVFYGCAIWGEVRRGNTIVEGVYTPRNRV